MGAESWDSSNSWKPLEIFYGELWTADSELQISRSVIEFSAQARFGTASSPGCFHVHQASRQACRGAFNGKAPSRLKCRDTPAGKNLQRFGAERSVRLCAANRHPGSKDPAHRRAEEGRILQRLCFHGCEDPCKDRTFRWMFNEDPGGTFLHSWTSGPYVPVCPS